VLSLTLGMWIRALECKKGSLVSESYLMLRKEAVDGCESKYNWCMQLKDALRSVGMLRIWDRASINEIKRKKASILAAWSKVKRNTDFNSARASASVPHYCQLKMRFRAAEPYMCNVMSKALASCLAQVRVSCKWLRINGHTVELKGADALCRCSQGPETLYHLLAECPNFEMQRKQLLPDFLSPRFNIYDFLNVGITHQKCLNLYLYVKKVVDTL